MGAGAGAGVAGTIPLMAALVDRVAGGGSGVFGRGRGCAVLEGVIGVEGCCGEPACCSSLGAV